MISSQHPNDVIISSAEDAEINDLIEEMVARMAIAESWSRLSLPRRLLLAAFVEFEAGHPLFRFFLFVSVALIVAIVVGSAMLSWYNGLMIGVSFGLLSGWLISRKHQ